MSNHAEELWVAFDKDGRLINVEVDVDDLAQSDGDIDGSQVRLFQHYDSPELARLRRMADKYAAYAVDTDVNSRCDCCGRRVPGDHGEECDVAEHLGLPREKGDGE